MQTGWKTPTTRTPIAGSNPAAGSDVGRNALTLSAIHSTRSRFQMFLQSRHQLDEIARAEAVVELVDEDTLPGVAAGARGPWQGEEVRTAGDPCRRPALDRRGPDLLIAEPAKELAKARDLLLIDAVKGLGRDVASGDAGAAGRDHDIDVGIGDPFPQLCDDPVLLVAHDPPRRDPVSGGGGEIRQRISGTVLRRVAGVGNGEQRDIDRQKGSGFVEPRHW